VKLSTFLRPTRDTDAVPAVDPARAEHERQVREARLQLARRRPKWIEVPESRLVRRGPFLVDAETDLVYVLRRGHVFEPGSATIGYVPHDTPMTYTVNEHGTVVFLEASGSRTWSEIVERKARRERAA
jgi:hypothetical protein